MPPLALGKSSVPVANSIAAERAKHAGDSSCLRLKQTQAQSSMQEWYCAQPTSAPSTWCKRTSLLKKLHAMPAGAPGTADKAGSPERVARQLSQMIETYQPDELILTGQIHDHAARVKSFEIAAQALAEIAA